MQAKLVYAHKQCFLAAMVLHVADICDWILENQLSTHKD